MVKVQCAKYVNSAGSWLPPPILYPTNDRLISHGSQCTDLSLLSPIPGTSFHCGCESHWLGGWNKRDWAVLMLRAWRLLPWQMRNHSTFGRLLANSLEVKFHLSLSGLCIFYCSFSHSASSTPASLLLLGAFALPFPLPGSLFPHIVTGLVSFL